MIGFLIHAPPDCRFAYLPIRYIINIPIKLLPQLGNNANIPTDDKINNMKSMVLCCLGRSLSNPSFSIGEII